MLVSFSQTVEDISENARANLEYIDMRFGAPVYVGDTIEVETKILGVRTSSSRPDLGIVHVQSTARKNVGAADEAIVMTWQRKVQVYKDDLDRSVESFQVEPDEVACELWLPEYRPATDYKSLAHLFRPDAYYEDLEPGTRIEHSRGRTVTDEHIHLTGILDNTSQVHCNQHMIDLDPSRYLGGELIIFGGIPFVLCLGLSGPDVGDNTLGDVVYRTGRHTAPLQRGRHRVRRYGDPLEERLPGPPGPGPRRDPTAGPQVRARGGRHGARRPGRLEEGAHLRAGAADRRQAPQPLRLIRRRLRGSRSPEAPPPAGPRESRREEAEKEPEREHTRGAVLRFYEYEAKALFREARPARSARAGSSGSARRSRGPPSRPSAGPWS